MSESWVEKHRPDSFDNIQGNNKALGQIKEWAESWSPGDEPQLLVGPPGVGKTTTAYVVSDTLGYPLNQINASAARKSDDIRRFARTMQTSPADSEHQLVLLDEVDSWHHSADKSPLIKALKDPRNPVILTANEKWEIPGSIKRAANLHEFKLGKRSRKAYLKDVAETEDLDMDSDDLEKLASAPDLRSAINDMQDWADSGKPPGFDDREWDDSPFSAIESLLRANGREWREATRTSSGTFDDPGSTLLWADDNLTEEYRGLEAGVAYDALSRADKWLGRAQRENYHFWAYASALLEQLPETRITTPYEGYINVNFPEWFKHSEDTHDGDSDEAKLYRKLKMERGFRMAGSFYEFKQRHLPVLRNLELEEKYDLALQHGLDEDEMDALGVSPDEYKDWHEVEEIEEGEGWSPDVSSAADW